jgi:hypothetical protein
MALARQLPALAAAFPDDDPDRLAASHHAALGLEVLPFVPVFLSPDGLLADPARDPIAAWLLAAARDAPGARTTLAQVLPPFVLALRDAGEPGWPTVAELALELVLATGPYDDVPLRGDLPDLDDPATDLRAIATALVRPARSGWFPTRRALARVAAAADVPAGFGDRADRLLSTLLAAVDAGTLPAAIAALDRELAGWDRDLGGLGAAVGPRRARLAGTREILARIRPPG